MVRRLVRLAWLGVVGVSLTNAFNIVQFSKISSKHNADVAIVLGTSVRGDQPSPVFAERIKHGIKLYRQNRVRFVVFTGGIGRAQKFSEGRVARMFALKRGVPRTHILIEESSRNTYENLLNARSQLRQHNLQSALIVSDPLHMRRALTMAHALHIEAHACPTPTTRFRHWYSTVPFLLYETFFLTLFQLLSLFR